LNFFIKINIHNKPTNQQTNKPTDQLIMFHKEVRYTARPTLRCARKFSTDPKVKFENKKVVGKLGKVYKSQWLEAYKSQMIEAMCQEFNRKIKKEITRPLISAVWGTKYVKTSKKN